MLLDIQYSKVSAYSSVCMNFGVDYPDPLNCLIRYLLSVNDK